MIKFNLTTLLILLSTLTSIAQFFTMDSTTLYEKKKLTFQEANIVSSYYSQDGNHSAVTGGIGTEKLIDFANTFDVKFFKEDGKGKRLNYGLDIGIDYYSSASSDNIDFKKSSASSQDVRFYPSLNIMKENLVKQSSIGSHLSFSQEYDYTSIGSGFSYNKSYPKSDLELGFKLNAFYDIYRLVIAEELRMNRGGGGEEDKGIEGTASRKSIDASFVVSKVLHSRLQSALVFDFAYQQGFLSTPFHRVYLNDGTLVKEVLPSQRLKIPLGIRLNWMAHDLVTVRTFYRYFKDSWGLTSNTVQLDLSYRFSPALVVGSYGRYYKQSGNKYFGAYETLQSGSEFRTSDYDLSDFSSYMVGLGCKYNTFKSGKYAVLSSIEIRGGMYRRSDGLKSWIVTLGLGFSGKK